jgi:hypothetical protein
MTANRRMRGCRRGRTLSGGQGGIGKEGPVGAAVVVHLRLVRGPTVGPTPIDGSVEGAAAEGGRDR